MEEQLCGLRGPPCREKEVGTVKVTEPGSLPLFLAEWLWIQDVPSLGLLSLSVNGMTVVLLEVVWVPVS